MFSPSFSIENIKNFPKKANKKFWLIEEENEQKISGLDLNQNQSKFPYYDAIRELEKIESCSSLRDKFDYIVSSNTLMKMNVIDFYHGKEEIVTMDDELPLLIFVVLHSKILNSFSQISLVDDYLSCFSEFDVERRFLFNLKVFFSSFYIRFTVDGHSIYSRRI